MACMYMKLQRNISHSNHSISSAFSVVTTNLLKQSLGPSLAPIEGHVKGAGQRGIAVGVWSQNQPSFTQRTEEGG